jgi:hypothetical protein
MKTREEVEALKRNWLKDPIYDLATVEGFEEYHGELDKFQDEQEAKWKAEADKKLTNKASDLGVSKEEAKHLSSFEKIERELRLLDFQIGDGGSAIGWANFVIAREQVRATLLLAAQVKRVGDFLEEKFESDEAFQNTKFMTDLYNIEKE